MIYIYIILASFVFSIFGSIKIYAIFFLFILILLFIIRVFKSFNLKRQLLYLFLSFLVIGSSGFFKNYSFYKDVDFSKKYFDGNLIILDVLSDRSFLVQDDENRNYVLYSDTLHNVGDSIYEVGNLKFFTTGNALLSSDFDLSKFDFFKGYYFMKGIYGNIYEKNSVYIGDADLCLPSKIKKFFREKVIGSYGKNKLAGLVLGMTIGDKSLIPKDDYQNFIDSSLVHIIAVSGGNLAVLIIFLSAILFFLPFYFRQAVIAIACVMFALVCGLSSSIFRALIMALLIIFALFGGKKIDSWKSILFAIIFMLIINPYYLIYDFGFLLSFFAIFGIKIFRINFFKSKKINDFLNPIFGAYLFTLPVILLYTSKISLFGFLSNIIVLPFVGFVMIYGFLSVSLYSFIQLDIVVYFGEVMMKYVYFVGKLFSDYSVYLNFENIYLRTYF